MAETIKQGCTGGEKWHWYNVQHDLVERGGLEEKAVTIDPLSMSQHGCGGEYNGNRFYFTWAKDAFLLVTSKHYDQTLIDAFSKVVEYKPFAKYTEPSSGLPTTEWNKEDPKGRYQELQTQGKLDLEQIK